MTDERSKTEPARTPGERRLARPPSDRYRELEATEPSDPPETHGSPGRGVAFGAFAAIAGAAILTVLGGLAFSAGLVAIAGVLGWAIARSIRAGTASSMSRPSRAVASVVLALLSVLSGQLGIWLFARSEGGVLGPLDYLAETFGVLVPLQLAAAAVVGWLSAR